MSQRLSWGSSTLLLTLLLPCPGTAQTSFLERLPAGAPLLLHIRGWEQTRGRLETLVKKAVPGPTGLRLLRQGRAVLDGLLEGRQLKGLPRDGSIFLVVLAVPDLSRQEPPALALLLQVSDYRAFRDSLLTEDERKTLEKVPGGFERATVRGRELWLVDRRDHAVLALDRKSATLLKRKPAETLAEKLPRSTAAKLLESDFSLLLNMAPILARYGESIQEARGPIQLEFVKRARDSGWDKEAAQIFKIVVRGLFQLVDDSLAVLVSASFAAEGLKAHVQVRVARGTDSSKFLKAIAGPPSDFKDLERLPLGLLSYSARSQSASANPLPDLVKSLTSQTPGASAKRLKEVAALKTKAAAGLVISGTSSRILGTGLHVEQSRDPAKLVEAALVEYAAVKAGEGLGGAMFKKKPDLTRDAQRHRGYTLHHARFHHDTEAMARMMTISARGFAGLRGQGEQEWFGTDGKTFVQITARDWEQARKFLDDYLDGKNALGGQEGYRQMRKNLPARCTDLMFEDLAEYFQQMAAFSVANVAGKFSIPEWRQPRIPRRLDVPPQFYGWATTLDEQQVAIDLWVPVFAAREAVRVMGSVTAQMKD